MCVQSKLFLFFCFICCRSIKSLKAIAKSNESKKQTDAIKASLISIALVFSLDHDDGMSEKFHSIFAQYASHFIVVSIGLHVKCNFDRK